MAPITNWTQLISLDEARYELDIPALGGEHIRDDQDSERFIGSLMGQAMARVEQRMGPVLERTSVMDAAGAWGADYPLELYLPAFLALTAVRYWSPGRAARLAADQTIARSELGRLESKPPWVDVWPPAAGWPDREPETPFRVEYKEGLDDADPRKDNIVEALVLSCRDLAEGFPKPSEAARAALLRLRPLAALRAVRRVQEVT